MSSEASTDSDSFTQKSSVTKKGNPRLESFRSNLKTNLFPNQNNETNLSTRACLLPLPSLNHKDSLNTVEQYKVENKKHDKRSSAYVSRMDKFRTAVKANLFDLSHKSSSISPHYKSVLTPDVSGIDITVIKPYSLPDTGSEFDPNVDSQTDLSKGVSQNMILEVMEFPGLKAQVSKSEETSEEKDVVEELVFRKHKGSIFYDSSETNVEDLKQELGITDDSHIHFFTGSFSKYYKEEEILGEGTSGVVKKCRDVETGEYFAVKIVQYKGDNEILMLIINEFAHLRKLNHKNIIKVYDLYVDYLKKKIYTVMELSECREMFETLKDLGHYSEAVASGIFKQILTGINYLHLNGVCHRDIKPNNILVSKDGKTVKITDFNVSKFLDKKQGQKKYSSLSHENYKMWTYTGTIAFTAPEVFLDSEYTECVDIWSAGVVLYTMLCGYQPFQADYVQDLIELIKTGKYEFHSAEWKGISDQAKNLIKHCLDVNIKTRFTPSDALMHSWIANQGIVSDTKITNIRDNFRVYFKKYTGKKNLGGDFGMKKMQVTSPNLAVTAIRNLQLKKRSGTIHLASTPAKFSPMMHKASLDERCINEESEKSTVESRQQIDSVPSVESLEELTLEKSVSSGMVERIKATERKVRAVQEIIAEETTPKLTDSEVCDIAFADDADNCQFDTNMTRSAVVGRHCRREGINEM